MASNNGSFETNIYNTLYEGFDNDDSFPSAPGAELPSLTASNGAPNTPDPDRRAASPGTEARQEEMASLILTERQRYLDNANASETGSVMDRHMMGYMRELESSAIAPQSRATAARSDSGWPTPPTRGVLNVQRSYLNAHDSYLNDRRLYRNDQGGYSNGQAGYAKDQDDHVDDQPNSICDQGEYANDQLKSLNGQEKHSSQRSSVRDVNFLGIYGRITQIEQTSHVANGLSQITTSAALDSCAPQAYATANAPSHGPTSDPAYNAPSDSNISQASSTSILRRRTAFEDLAHEAGYEHTPFDDEVEDVVQETGHENIDISDVNAFGAPGLVHEAGHENTAIEGEDVAQEADLENSYVDASEAPPSPTNTLHPTVQAEPLRTLRIRTNTQYPTVQVNPSWAFPPLTNTRDSTVQVNGSERPPTYTNTQYPTVQSAPSSPPAVPQAPEQVPAAAQRPLRVVNGNITEDQAAPVVNADHQDPPQYADVGRNAQDHPLPPHIDMNDPVGADFLAGMQQIRRAGDRIQTLGASMGLLEDDPAVQEILVTLGRGSTHFTTGFRRAAAAAANERNQHQLTNDLFNRMRLANRQVQGAFMAVTARAERAEEQLEVVQRQEEYLRTDLAAARLSAARGTARAATLRGSLAERRAENERLLGEVAEMERTLYGYD